MKREEAIQQDLETIAFLLGRDAQVDHEEGQRLTKTLIELRDRALSSPCACGGEVPAAKVAAWMDADVHASLSVLAAPFRLPSLGMVHLYGEDSKIGNHRKHVHLLMFDALPAEEEASKQG